MRNACYKKRVIYFSFVSAIILQLLFANIVKWYIQPSWSMMLLIYWGIITPQQVNIGTGFILGLIIDFMFSPVLGIHALSFSMIVYLIIRKIYFFKNIDVLWQSFYVIFFSVIDQVCKILIIWLITTELNNLDCIWNSIVNGIFWPILLFMMRKVHLS